MTGWEPIVVKPLIILRQIKTVETEQSTFGCVNITDQGPSLLIGGSNTPRVLVLRPRFSHSQCSDFDADKLSGVGINSSGGMLVLKINFDRKFNDPRARKIASWRVNRVCIAGKPLGQIGREVTRKRGVRPLSLRLPPPRLA